MPLRIAVQTAPELRGIASIVVGSWTGPVPALHGTYVGETSGTVSFLCTAGGTIGTTAVITVTWSGFGTTGQLNLGTAAGYTVNKKLNLPYGLSISFGAGTLTLAQTFNLTYTYRRVVPYDHRIVETEIEHTAVDLVETSFRSRDELVTTFDERRFRQARAQLREPRLSVDWMRREERRKLLDMLHRRQRVTVFENYGPDTIMLWRGGGLNPLIGRKWTFTRTGTRTYRDPDSELFRLAPTGEPRISGGVETESGHGLVAPPVGWDDRHPIPSEYNHHGRAFVLGDTVTNMVEAFHPEVADDGTVSLHWEAAGGATVALSQDVLSPLDPLGGWDRKFLRGVAKVELFGATGTNAAQTPSADYFAVTTGEKYTVQVWLRGKGYVTVAMQTGIAVPSLAFASYTRYLRPDKWIKVTMNTPAVPASHTIAMFKITPSGSATTEQEVFYIGPVACMRARGTVQIETHEEPIPCDGAATQVGAEVLTTGDPLPKRGTLMFWMRWPPDGHDLWIGILKDSTGHFALERSGASGSEEFNWYTIGGAGGRALASNIPVPTNIPWETWVHVALAWDTDEVHTGPPVEFDRLRKRAWINGAKVLDELVAAANRYDGAWGAVTWFPTNDTGPENDWGYPYDARIQEVRLDSVVLSDAEVLAAYNRQVASDHEMLARELCGRYFEIEDAAETWLSPVNRDKMRGDVRFFEVDFHEPSLVTPR